MSSAATCGRLVAIGWTTILLVGLSSSAAAVTVARDIVVPLSPLTILDTLNGQREFLTRPRLAFPEATIGIGDELVLNVLFAGGERLQMIDQ